MSESRPPSNAQLGIVASSPVPPAVYTYMSAATSTPRARAATIVSRTSRISVPQTCRNATLR